MHSLLAGGTLPPACPPIANVATEATAADSVAFRLGPICVLLFRTAFGLQYRAFMRQMAATLNSATPLPLSAKLCLAARSLELSSRSTSSAQGVGGYLTIKVYVSARLSWPCGARRVRRSPKGDDENQEHE
jgi:hypothetical protein